MKKIDWAILVSDHIIDRRTGRLSIINIIDEIKINKKEPPEQKIQIPVDFTLAISARLGSLEGSEEEMRIRFRDPERQYLKSETSKVPVSKKRVHRIMVSIFLLPVTQQGEYCFEIQLKISGRWKTFSEIPLAISFTDIERAHFIPIE